MLIRSAGKSKGQGGTPQRRSGLSLLEVLVALAIFLFALVALGQLITFGNDQALDVQWLSLATMKAQSKLNEVAGGSLPLTSVGDTPFDDDAAWNWSMTAEADNTPGLYRVAVTVSRKRTDGTRFELAFHQFVLDPLQRGNTDGSATGTDDTGSSSSSSSSSTTGGN